MTKTQTIYNCSSCDYQSPKWLGRCPECQQWNTFQEEQQIKTTPSTRRHFTAHQHQLQSIPQQLPPTNSDNRYQISFPELNQTLGGGLKKGSLTLLSGEPGIGKSTLTLQLCQEIASQNDQVLYLSGEESADQIISRAFRLGISHPNIKIANQNNLELITQEIHNSKPDLIIIDSIQVIASQELPSIAGSINQVRFCTETLMEIAKSHQKTILIIGHVTKDGNLAGPRILEHLVDTVLFLEGERYQNFRVIRSLKNRYGSTNDICILEMAAQGLKEVTNPSQIFLEGRQHKAIGSAITVNLEGNKAILLETQALTNTSPYGYPKRTSLGYDLNRIQLLAAVIQKYLKVNLSNQDIYINIVGGFKLTDTANDLAIVSAIISSHQKIPLPEHTAFIGEVGLSGEIRAPFQLEKRLREIEKMGFKNVITKTTQTPKSPLNIINISNLQELKKSILSQSE